MYLLFSSAWGFAFGYLCLMVPTYVLPYFGSNSVIVSAIGAIVGRGLTPLWWVHAWCLVLLILMTSVRGKSNGRSYLMLFPIIGGLFDLTPFLSFIPFVPTVAHIVTLMLGITGRDAEPQKVTNRVTGELMESHSLVWENWTAGGFSVLAIAGSLWFIAGVRPLAQPAGQSFSTTEIKTKSAPVRTLGPIPPPPSIAAAPASSNPSGLAVSARPNKPKHSTNNASNLALPPQKNTGAQEKPQVLYIDINK